MLAGCRETMEGGNPLCLLALVLTGKSMPSLALDPTSLGFWHTWKTSWDIQSCGVNNYWNFCWETTIVGLVGPWPISCSNKSPSHMYSFCKSSSSNKSLFTYLRICLKIHSRNEEHLSDKYEVAIRDPALVRGPQHVYWTSSESKQMTILFSMNIINKQSIPKIELKCLILWAKDEGGIQHDFSS